MLIFTHFIRKVFAVKILLSGKFLLFLTLWSCQSKWNLKEIISAHVDNKDVYGREDAPSPSYDNCCLDLFHLFVSYIFCSGSRIHILSSGINAFIYFQVALLPTYIIMLFLKLLRLHCLFVFCSCLFAAWIALSCIYDVEAVSYTHLTLPTNREV